MLVILNTNKQNIIEGRLMSIDALRGFDMLWIIGGGEILWSLHKVFDNIAVSTLAAVKWLILYIMLKKKIFFKV